MVVVTKMHEMTYTEIGNMHTNNMRSVFSNGYTINYHGVVSNNGYTLLF